MKQLMRKAISWQLSFWFGVSTIAILIVIAFVDKTPNAFSLFIYQAVLATSIGGLAALLPFGWFEIPKYARVGAGLLIWLIIFFSNIRPLLGVRICPPAKLGTYGVSDLAACFSREGSVIIRDDFRRPGKSVFKPQDHPDDRLYVSGGSLVYDRRANDRSVAGYVVHGTEHLRNFLFHVTVSYEGGTIQGDPSVAIYLLRQNNPDETMKRGYVLTAHIPDSNHDPNDEAYVKSDRRGKVSLYEKVAGEAVLRNPPLTSYTVKAAKWERMAVFVRCNRDRLQIFINEDQAFDINVEPEHQNEGEIRLGAGGRAMLFYNDLVIAKLP